jgi:membrane fusion protein (multidrug efflux system)
MLFTLSVKREILSPNAYIRAPNIEMTQIWKENTLGMKNEQPPMEREKAGLTGETEEPIEATPLYQKKRIIIPALLALVIICIAGWYWYVNMRDFESTDDAFIDADRVSVSSKMLGRITQLLVDEGDSVSPGEIIVRLDDADLKAQQVQGEAVLTAAEENVHLAKVNLDNAIVDFQRAERQLKGNVITQEQFEHAQKSRDATAAQHAVALAQVGTARAQLGVIRTNLSNMVITAPMRGVVSKRWALAGDVVQPAQPIVSIYDLSRLWVTANIEETKLSLIRLNAPVEIAIDSYPDRPLRGKVIQLGSNTAAQFSLIPPNNAAGNFTKVTQRIPIKIALEQEPGRPVALLPGMSVEVRIKVR